MSGGIEGRRVLITGAARGIGAATARRLHERGARVALAGLEPELLAAVAAGCGDAPWAECDVSDREQVAAAVAKAVEGLGGLDVVIANAGIAAQLPLIGGEPRIFEQTIRVNLFGVYNTIREAAPHVAHENGYVLVVSSMAAAVKLPLMGAYSASKAGVEALGDTLRIELASTGARVGVAYFAELDTDMTSRGFDTRAAHQMFERVPWIHRVAPLEAGISAIERGVERRARRVVAPSRMRALIPARDYVQRGLERFVPRRALAKALDTARAETVSLTTEQPDR
jgi:NAD(P)-dependent dehydrogenase (short-subunit alcohol dehydrogenase family)